MRMKKKKITINSSEKNQQSERKLEYSYQNPSGYMKFENRKVFQEKSSCLKMAELKLGKINLSCWKIKYQQMSG